jgi:hypothetical protein
MCPDGLFVRATVGAILRLREFDAAVPRTTDGGEISPPCRLPLLKRIPTPGI